MKVAGQRPCAKEGCALFGQMHPRCAGHRKRTDPPVPCALWPMTGQWVCARHGGRAGQNLAAAERRTAEAAAVEVVVAGRARLGVVGPPVNVVDALEELIRESSMNVVVLRSVVGALELRSGEGGVVDADHRVDALVAMYDAERDRLAGYLKSAAQLGLDQRRLQVEAARVDVIFAAMTRAASVAVAALVAAVGGVGDEERGRLVRVFVQALGEEMRRSLQLGEGDAA